MQIFDTWLEKAKFLLYMAVFACIVFAGIHVYSLQKKVQSQTQTIEELNAQLDESNARFEAANRSLLEFIETTDTLRQNYENFSMELKKVKETDPTAALWCDTPIPDSLKCVLNDSK